VTDLDAFKNEISRWTKKTEMLTEKSLQETVRVANKDLYPNINLIVLMPSLCLGLLCPCGRAAMQGRKVFQTTSTEPKNSKKRRYVLKHKDK
jgi:hypothetical protein